MFSVGFHLFRYVVLFGHLISHSHTTNYPCTCPTMRQLPAKPPICMTLQFLKVYGSHHSTNMISGDIYGNVHIECDVQCQCHLATREL